MGIQERSVTQNIKKVFLQWFRQIGQTVNKQLAKNGGGCVGAAGLLGVEYIP